MHAKTLLAALAVLASCEARHFSIQDDPIDNEVVPDKRYDDSIRYNSAEDDNDEDYQPYNENKEDDSAREEFIPKLSARLGGLPEVYDGERSQNGVINLRNKFGGDRLEEDVEQENGDRPSWLKRQWRRLFTAKRALAATQQVSAEKVKEITDKICNSLKFVIHRAAKLCDVVPLKFCSKFYGPKEDVSSNELEPNKLNL